MAHRSNTRNRAIGLLEAAGVLEGTAGKTRDRVYMYQAHLNRLCVGTEPGGQA